MYEELLRCLRRRPEPYEPSPAKFWDDEHISKGMLAAHLDPEVEAATRKLPFVRRSVQWIAATADPRRRPQLLDLGCGPGIYAELLTQAGFCVTGIDLSPRSVAYAQASAARNNLAINYVCRNYLELDCREAFDVVTLIYCDFGVLNPADRKTLLGKIRQALRPGGRLIFDACTPAQYADRPETTDWSCCDGGYWSPAPYACFYSFYRYDACRTFADRYVIVEANNFRCYNIWNHGFTADELRADLTGAGFAGVDFWGDVAGAAYDADSKTICAVARK